MTKVHKIYEKCFDILKDNNVLSSGEYFTKQSLKLKLNDLGLLTIFNNMYWVSCMDFSGSCNNNIFNFNDRFDRFIKQLSKVNYAQKVDRGLYKKV